MFGKVEDVNQRPRRRERRRRRRFGVAFLGTTRLTSGGVRARPFPAASMVRRWTGTRCACDRSATDPRLRVAVATGGVDGAAAISRGADQVLPSRARQLPAGRRRSECDAVTGGGATGPELGAALASPATCPWATIDRSTGTVGARPAPARRTLVRARMRRWSGLVRGGGRDEGCCRRARRGGASALGGGASALGGATA